MMLLDLAFFELLFQLSVISIITTKWLLPFFVRKVEDLHFYWEFQSDSQIADYKRLLQVKYILVNYTVIKHI